MYAEALADLGATTNFIDKVFVEKNHLVTYKLAEAFNVTNADGTLNKAGQIKNYIQAYTEIGDHRVTIILLVASLSDKDMMIGYSYFYEHNPQIDWQFGEWEHTRCLDTCADRACKTKVLDSETDELHLEMDLPWDLSLDNIGIEDSDNPIINWADLESPNNQEMAEVITTMLDEKNIDEVLDEDEDTSNWKSHVPE